MKLYTALLITAAALLTSCSQAKVAMSDSITSQELEGFFQRHKVNGHNAVAVKKLNRPVS